MKHTVLDDDVFIVTCHLTMMVSSFCPLSGHFVLSPAEKELFEHHQEMLEKHTEKLSELTEADTTTLKEEDRAHVVNLTR